MTGTTGNSSAILTAEQIGDLVVRPLIAQSLAGQILTAVQTASHTYRIPVVTADPSAAWTAEGAEIGTSDAVVDEVIVTPSKLAALTVITNELANDSDPAAAQVIGDGLVRDLVRKVDVALFAATTVNGPNGLLGLSGVQTVNAGSAYTNADPFSDAQFLAANANAATTAFAVNPATAQTLAKLKQATGSNKPLLGEDPTVPGRRQILGSPLLVSPAVPAANGQVWAVSAQYAYLVIREDTQIEADTSAFFSSDRTAIRAKLRVGFGFPHPSSIVKIATS